MKRSKIFHLSCITLIIVSVIFIILGCDEPGYMISHDEYGNIISSPDSSYKVSYDDTGNKIITIKEGIGYFNMVYPEGFELGIIKIDNSGGIESLLVDFIGQVTPDVGLPLIGISVFEYDDSFPAERAAESLLNTARNYSNFKLLDESTLTVAGVTAYQYSYYSDVWPYDPHIPPPEDAVLVTRLDREVHFDCDGFSWFLSLGSDPSREEHDMAVFDKVLESFKVLD